MNSNNNSSFNDYDDNDDDKIRNRLHLSLLHFFTFYFILFHSFYLTSNYFHLQRMEMNCSSSRLALIDAPGILTLLDLEARISEDEER